MVTCPECGKELSSTVDKLGRRVKARDLKGMLNILTAHFSGTDNIEAFNKINFKFVTFTTCDECKMGILLLNEEVGH